MRRVVFVSLSAFAIATVVFALLRAPDASASSAYTSPYTYTQTYGSALRLLRVDMNLTITEKDKDLGYVLFEYTSPESGARQSKGSLELVEGKEGITVAVQLPEMPGYHERMIIDALERKLESEYGAPPVRKKKQKPSEGEDAGDGEKNKDADQAPNDSAKDS